MYDRDECLLAMLIYVISFFTAFIGPLIIWLVKKDDSDFVDYHGREYFNFFITTILYTIISGLLIIFIVGFFLLWIVGIWALIVTIIAAVKAFDGQKYRIPFIIRIL